MLRSFRHSASAWGTKRGFIAVKSNCSIQSYVPALSALMDFEPTEVSVCTYQAISGAGKTFETWPEMVDNVIPYIGGEEEKSEKEPMKIWGHIEGDHIESATTRLFPHSACALHALTVTWLPLRSSLRTSRARKL